MARRIVAADTQGLGIRAFSGNICTRVRNVTERALVFWGVSISRGYFAFIELPVDELEKGDSFPGAIGELLVKCLAHGLRAGPSLFVGNDETHVERGLV